MTPACAAREEGRGTTPPLPSRPRPVSLASAGTPSDALDLVGALLRFDPKRRLSASKARAPRGQPRPATVLHPTSHQPPSSITTTTTTT